MNRSIIVLLSLSLMGMTGCSKFLEEKNPSSITIDNYYKNATQAQSAVDGAYEQLRVFQNTDGYGENPWISMEMLVGHAKTLGQSTYNSSMIKHTAGTSDPVFMSVWKGFYNGISNCNVAIQHIPDVSMDDTQKSNLMGQLYFLRAFYYYQLVRLYGDVPLVLEAVNANSPLLYPSRTSAAEVYDQIVKDLQLAETSSLPTTDVTGRVSVMAVKSLLSSVYLTMAGYPLQKGTAYYQLAADKAAEVINSGNYQLFTSYAYLHDRAHKNGSEFILQVQYSGSIIFNNITRLIIPEKIGISKFGDEYGSLMPYNQFVASYEPGDKRAEEKQFFFTNYNGRDFGEYALYKYWLEEAANPTTGDANSDENWTLFRLPEIMLIYAEASNEVNGPTDAAYTQINAIRSRANLPALSGLTKDAFRQEIWKERYHELAFEDKAYFDIQRTHMMYDLPNNVFVDATSKPNIQGITFTTKYYIWPLPQNELDANKNLTQNDEWK